MEIKLTYGSATLRQKDIDLYEPGQWLNDQCILFYFEYLTRKVEKEMLFLDPGASYLLLFENDLEDLAAAMCNVSLARRKFIFCAINDNNNPMAAGGGHWTLLVYDPTRNQGFHYDSLGMHSSNCENSQNILSKLCILLSLPPATLTNIILNETQSNGSDCGVYILMIAEEICKNPDLFLRNQDNLTRKSAYNFRKHLKNLISSLIY